MPETWLLRTGGSRQHKRPARNPKAWWQWTWGLERKKSEANRHFVRSFHCTSCAINNHPNDSSTVSVRHYQHKCRQHTTCNNEALFPATTSGERGYTHGRRCLYSDAPRVWHPTSEIQWRQTGKYRETSIRSPMDLVDHQPWPDREKWCHSQYFPRAASYDSGTASNIS